MASLPPNHQEKASASGGVRNGPGLSAAPRPGSANQAISPKVPDRKDSLKDIPPELQGVSVKDLVKALGRCFLPFIPLLCLFLK